MKTHPELGRNDLCHCGSKQKYKRCHEEEDKKKATLILKIQQSGFSWKNLFIGGPYKVCPGCGRPTFGVDLGTGTSGYVRKCKECPYTQAFPLPPIHKYVIYLDQFVISNIAKVLDPNTAGHAATSQETFWIEAYKKLDRLMQLNIVVCPDSFFHNDESLLSTDPPHKSLRRVYERLSNRKTFYNHETITRFQVAEHLENYLNGEPDKFLKCDPESVVMSGDLHEWTARIYASVNMRPYPGQIDAIRDERDRLYKAMKPVFDRWQGEKGRKLMDWVFEEANAFGKGTVQAYLKHLKKREESMVKYAQQIQAGEEPDVSLDDIMPPPAAELIQQIDLGLRKRGYAKQDIVPKTAEYLGSPSLINIPSNHIAALLYAGIARKAASGQNRYPSRSTFADVNAISSLLPYCDAIFIDNAMAALLKEGPIDKQMVRYPAKIFCMNNKNDFLEYLDNLERNASPEHLATALDYHGKCEPDLGLLTRPIDD